MIVVVVVSSIGSSINRSADSIISSCNISSKREAGFHLVRQTNIGILNKHSSCLLLHLAGGDDLDDDPDDGDHDGEVR